MLGSCKTFATITKVSVQWYGVNICSHLKLFRFTNITVWIHVIKRKKHGFFKTFWDTILSAFLISESTTRGPQINLCKPVAKSVASVQFLAWNVDHFQSTCIQKTVFDAQLGLKCTVMFFFSSFVHWLDQTALSSWFIKTSRTKCRVTRRGWAPRWRRSAAWRWDSGTKLWCLLWPFSAWPRPPCWASIVRRPCWRGRPACDTAWVKVSRTRPAGAFS